MTKLTKAARSALELLMEHGDMTGGTFAMLYWRAKWQAAHTTDRRHGLRRAGGAYLSRLMAKGLVAPGDPLVSKWNCVYAISQDGRAALRAAREDG